MDDPRRRRPDITLANEVLGWRPTASLEAGLRKTIEYFEHQLGTPGFKVPAAVNGHASKHASKHVA
jgi:UDP-glucuronate decarboxylase